MKNTLIADTGFWYALMDERDQFHQVSMRYLAGCRQSLVTTWPVLTETCYMLLSRHSMQAVSRFLAMGGEGMYTIYALDSNHLLKASGLMNKYADLPMDLADATMVILAEELGHGRILSTDKRDFNAYRWKNHEPFENLLLPNA